jgi:PAS domain S-box-containing protein
VFPIFGVRKRLGFQLFVITYFHMPDISGRIDPKVYPHVVAQADFISRVMDASPDIIYIANIHTGTTVYINKVLLTELGYSSEEIRTSQLEKKFSSLYHPDDLETVADFKNRLLDATDEATVEFEARMKAQNGAWQWIRTRGKVFQRDDDGNPEKYIGFSQNITANKTFEEERRQNNILTELNRVKTEFFSNVSHEFKTPLALILGPLEDLLANTGKTLQPAQVQKLQMVYRNALRLQKLATTQLDFSRLEAGRIEAVFQPTNLAAFTEGLVSNFRSLIEGVGMKLNVICQEVGEPIYVCRDMWETIVFNLLSNAFKYTFDGKISVSLRANKKHVRLHVSDTGIGISNDNVRRIFERFTRIDPARSRTTEGTGIGLALVQELIHLHGGTIKVKSTPGSGSTFIVTIPKGKKHLPPRQILELNDVKTKNIVADGFVEQSSGWLTDDVATTNGNLSSEKLAGRPTVMVVDDNRDMRDYLVNMLSTDYNVVVADQGVTALSLLESGPMPGLIISDIMMHEMDGIELLKELRSSEKYRNLPVLMLSARADEESKSAAMKLVANDYLVKPFSAAVLKNRIKILLKEENTPKM